MVLEEIRGLCKSESKAEEAGIALDVVEQMISSKSISLLTSMVSLQFLAPLTLSVPCSVSLLSTILKSHCKDLIITPSLARVI